MDDNADSSKRRPPFEPSQRFVIEFQRFKRDRQGELAGLKNKGVAVGDDDGPHQVLDGGCVTEVDEGVAGMLKDAELVTKTEID